MKKRPTDKTPSTDQQDPQRRRISKLIAAVTVLGTGLGVNMREVFAEDTKPSSSDIKLEKTQSPQPGTRQFKVESPTRPGATQAKPVPARPGVMQDKHMPSVEHTKIESRPGAGMLKE